MDTTDTALWIALVNGLAAVAVAVIKLLANRRRDEDDSARKDKAHSRGADPSGDG